MITIPKTIILALFPRSFMDFANVSIFKYAPAVGDSQPISSSWIAVGMTHHLSQLSCYGLPLLGNLEGESRSQPRICPAWAYQCSLTMLITSQQTPPIQSINYGALLVNELPNEGHETADF